MFLRKGIEQVVFWTFFYRKIFLSWEKTVNYSKSKRRYSIDLNDDCLIYLLPIAANVTDELEGEQLQDEYDVIDLIVQFINKTLLVINYCTQLANSIILTI